MFDAKILTEWLDQLLPGTYCGWTSSLSNCPLAQCGTWQGFADVTVSWESVGWLPARQRRKTFRPHDPWTKTLVRRIDQVYGSQHQVTTDELRELLSFELRELLGLYIDVENAFAAFNSD